MSKNDGFSSEDYKSFFSAFKKTEKFFNMDHIVEKSSVFGEIPLMTIRNRIWRWYFGKRTKHRVFALDAALTAHPTWHWKEGGMGKIDFYDTVGERKGKTCAILTKKFELEFI